MPRERREEAPVESMGASQVLAILSVEPDKMTDS